MKQTNQKCCEEVVRRADSACDVIDRAYHSGYIDDLDRSDPVDLITNLLHLADRSGGDVGRIIERARQHWADERHGGMAHGE